MHISRYLRKYLLKRKKKAISIQKQCTFWEGSMFDEDTFFEGKNLMGEYSQLMTSCIGFASYIGDNSSLTRVIIGRYTSIGPGVTNVYGNHPTHHFVSTHPCFYSMQKQVGFTFSEKQKFNEYTYIDKENKYLNMIGNDVWIGERVLLFSGIVVGDGAIIGAGALVNKDVPPYAIVAGVPAKIIGWRFNEEERNFLLQLRWWEKDYDWIREHAKWFDDIESLRNNL